MRKMNSMESKASKLAKEILDATGGDWIMAARELKAQAKQNPELLTDVVGPVISDRIWQAIERVTPITMGGGSLLNCPLSGAEHRLLGGARKADLEKEIGFIEVHARKCIENVKWLEALVNELDEGQTIREKFTAETLEAFREKFYKEWDGKLVIETPEKPSQVRKLAVEALYINKGEWFLALQSLTQRVNSDSRVLYQLMSPVFYTMVWPIFSQVSSDPIDMKPPFNSTLSSGWIFGDALTGDLMDEIAIWEDAGRYYLRKIRWFELIMEATGPEDRVEDHVSGSEVKKLWNKAFQDIA
ncbi:MAG: hypothetical protein JXK94_02920 [Deltaproteobacteria bacterium]|nr:hypothetical protein [Deltaproteobacteria bacterium]